MYLSTYLTIYVSILLSTFIYIYVYYVYVCAYIHIICVYRARIWRASPYLQSKSESVEQGEGAKQSSRQISKDPGIFPEGFVDVPGSFQKIAGPNMVYKN